jgi:hypothetical protein
VADSQNVEYGMRPLRMRGWRKPHIRLSSRGVEIVSDASVPEALLDFAKDYARRLTGPWCCECGERLRLIGRCCPDCTAFNEACHEA